MKKRIKEYEKNIITDNDFLDMLESIRNRCISVGCTNCLYKNQECILFEDSGIWEGTLNFSISLQ